MEKVFNEELKKEFLSASVGSRPLNDILLDLTKERLSIIDDREKHKDHWWSKQGLETPLNTTDLGEYDRIIAYCFTCKICFRYPSETTEYYIKREAEKEWNIKIL